MNGMAQAIAFSRNALQSAQSKQADFLSSMIVLGCAAALIFAGQVLPA